ncbi:hypothetical protein TB1_046024 [Malus domestica]
MNSRLGPTYPHAENIQEAELGHQLSLLNLIALNEEADNPGNISTALIASIDHDTGWIIDSGATDHMTYDHTLFNFTTSPPQNSIITANGGVAPVIGAGLIGLTPTLSLHNCLLVPTLSSNLLSMGQVIEQLDCVVLMFPSFCLLQDIRTQAIIGRGTKSRGLYYVDDVALGRVHQVRSQDSRKLKTIQLWHRLLGHASFGYLQKLLPSLFSNISDSSLKCNVCTLAKSHRVSYSPSFNKRTVPFELIHSDMWRPSPVTT